MVNPHLPSIPCSRIFKLLLFYLIAIGISFSCSPQRLLFNGQTYDGWEGAKDFFRIEDEAIVAGAMDRRIPKNQFLCTEKSYENFDLRMKVKFLSPNKNNNGGIQFRSSRIPNHHEVIGYQADVGYAGKLVWGSLYDESRRRRFLKEAEAEVVEKTIKSNDWNDYRIRCKNDEIQIWLNDVLVLEYVEEDEKIDRTGVICVQIHGGAPSEAWYRDIEIKEL